MDFVKIAGIKYMIKSLSIKNFQSHYKSELTFHEGVNVIVGSSDSGKTVIIRALRWIINNSPSGDSFRTYGSKETEAILKTSDNDLISRIKSNSNNEYKIKYNNRHSEPEIFKAFGTEVPEKIQNLLNIREAHIGGTVINDKRTGGIKYNINLQYQLDSPFLLSNNSGEVARILNNIVNLDIIDQSLSSIAKRNRNTQGKIDHEIKYLEKLGNQIKEFNYLDQMESDIIKVEEKEARQVEINNKAFDLFNYIQDTDKLSSESARISDFLKIEPYTLDLERKAVTSNTTQQKHTNLSLLIEDIQDLEAERVKIEKVLNGEGEVIKLQGMENKVNEMGNNLARMDILIDSIQTTETNLSDIDGELKFCQNEFNKLMPSTCPLCEQEMK